MSGQPESQLIQRLQALADIAAAINRSLNLDDVLDLILANIERVVAHDAANIILIRDNQAHVVRSRGSAGQNDNQQQLISVLRLEDYPRLRQLVQTGSAVVIEDTIHDPEWIVRPETAWIKSLIGVPIKFQEQVLGIVTIESATPGFFTTEQASYLQSFADQAGIAVQNARLYAEVQHYAIELEKRISERTVELQAANLVLRGQINDRIRIEQALRESEKKYRSLYTAMNEGVVLNELVYDDQGRPVDYVITDVNPAYETILGISRTEAIGRRASELYGTGKPPLLETFAGVATTGHPVSFDLYWPPMDRHFSISAFSPAPGQFANVFTDVTESKRAEQIIRDSEARYRGLFDGNPLGLYRTTISGQFLDANDALVKILGFPDRDHLLRTNARDLYLDPAIRERVIEDAYRDSGLHDYEIQFRCFDGKLIWVSDNARPVFDEDGQIAYFEGAIQDITARKLAERAEHEQRVLAEALRDVITALNSTLDFDEVLGRILTNIERVVPHVWADVMLIEGDYARIVRSRNLHREAGVTVPVPGWNLNETQNLKQMYEERRPLVIPDTHNYPGWRLEPGTEWIKSFVGAPIRFNEQVLGFVNVASSQVSFYNNDHARRLQGFADQAAIALRNARLYEFIHRRQRYLETLHRVSRRAVPEHDRQALMQAIVEGLAAGFDYDIVGILLTDEADGVLRQAAAAGSHPLVREIGLTYTQPLDSGVMGWVVRNNQPRMVNDTSTDPDYRRPSRGLDSGSMLAAPIRHRGRVIGVLNVLSTHKNAFDELDQETLLELAEDLGLYLENLTLNEQAQMAATLAERNRLARDLHDSVTQSLYSLTLFAEAARQHALTGDSKLVASHLNRIGRIGQQALKEMRLLVYELRPEALEREGLIGALRRRLEAVERRSGIDARLVADQLIDLPARIEQELYRIAQEALNNALKHAEATEIKVHLQMQTRRLRLEIADNGCGFDVSAVRDSGGMGLTSMRERTHNIGGQIMIASQTDEGTSVAVEVDIAEESGVS